MTNLPAGVFWRHTGEISFCAEVRIRINMNLICIQFKYETVELPYIQYLVYIERSTVSVSVWLPPWVVAPRLCFSVFYNELSVLWDWSGRKVETGSWDRCLTPSQLPEKKKKKPICVLLLTSVVQWELSREPLRSPSLHPSACPSLPSSLAAQ